MRLELVLPDSVSVARRNKIAAFLKQLERKPELVDNIEVGDDSAHNAWILAQLDIGIADLDEGRFAPMEESESIVSEMKSEWLRQNP